MAMDIQDDQKVVVYKDGVDQYEGLWGSRDEDYDGDFYLLADVEEADITVVCGRRTGTAGDGRTARPGRSSLRGRMGPAQSGKGVKQWTSKTSNASPRPPA